MVEDGPLITKHEQQPLSQQHNIFNLHIGASTQHSSRYQVKQTQQLPILPEYSQELTTQVYQQLSQEHVL